MENKLGILNPIMLESIETSLIETKIALLDYECTFNEPEHNFNFLVKLHEYLFGSIYVIENHDLRSYVDKDFQEHVNRLLKILTKKGIDGVFDNESLEIFARLWDLQIFIDGNTKTLIAFLKVYVSAFRLEKFIDFKELYLL